MTIKNNKGEMCIFLLLLTSQFLGAHVINHDYTGSWTFYIMALLVFSLAAIISRSIRE